MHKNLWESKDNILFLNPKASVKENQHFYDLFHYGKQNCQSHIFIASSGTSSQDFSQRKLLAIAKSAFLTAAESANQFLQTNKNETWLKILPDFHVGGLSILARAYLNEQNVLDLNSQNQNHNTNKTPVSQDWHWDAVEFCQQISDFNIQLCSLVPTQIYDLVQAKLNAPKCVRLILVGGAKLETNLYFSARNLGWPLLPSFGMSELGSQIATAELSSLSEKMMQTITIDTLSTKEMHPTQFNEEKLFSKNSYFPDYKILNHIKAKTNQDGFLCFQSKSLFTAYVSTEKDKCVWQTPELDSDNFWISSDTGKVLDGSKLQVLARDNERIKIAGEAINLQNLDAILLNCLSRLALPSQSAAIVALPDPRLGNKIVLAHSIQEQSKLEELQKAFNQECLAIAKIKDCFYLAKLSFNSLGKLQRKQIQSELLKL